MKMLKIKNVCFDWFKKKKKNFLRLNPRKIIKIQKYILFEFLEYVTLSFT